MNDLSGKGTCTKCNEETESRNWQGVCSHCLALEYLGEDDLSVKIYERISRGGNSVVMAKFIADMSRGHRTSSERVTPKTKLYTDWDTDPFRLSEGANDRIGTLYQPANEEIPVGCRIGDIVHFQIVVAPPHEGEGYYMFILYELVYDDEP